MFVTQHKTFYAKVNSEFFVDLIIWATFGNDHINPIGLDTKTPPFQRTFSSERDPLKLSYS